MLDKDKIKYEKNEKGEYTVSGIDEQLKDVKEKYSFLFEDDGVFQNCVTLDSDETRYICKNG